jgi:hypothetical protein
VIPHFLYFRALRLDGELWTFLMTWGPGLGLIVALAGLVIGVVHFRPSRPFRFSRIPSYLPYRGWLRWHYAAGLVFGVVTVTFVWSGLLSMEPWSWTLRDSSLAGATRRAFPTGTGEIGEYPRPDAGGWRQVLGSGEVREVAFTRILGEPHLVARSAAEVPAAMGWPDGGHQPYFVQRSSDPARTVFSGTLETQDPLTTSEVVARISETITARVEAADWLDAYDTYYYSREGRSPLPVVRVKLADPDETWLYVDPGVAQVVGRINRVNRMERWLYAGLHTFDFPFLYERRPLWQAVIVTFCLGGAFISGVGFLLGLNRILRGFRRVPATGHA